MKTKWRTTVSLCSHARLELCLNALLLLSRFFMRLDNVLVRIRDTRVFIEFETGEVIREYVAKEEKYEVVRQVSSDSRSLKLD